MAGFKRVGIVLLIFLGPGLTILFIAKTCENHFITLPYLGWEYTYDTTGKKLDSTLHTVPDFTLTKFDGTPITRDSIRGKFIILSTIQNTCPELSKCGMGMYVFNELLFQKIVDNQGKNRYGNVKVLSILTDANGNPDTTISPLLREQMAVYNQNIWWMATGDPTPLFSFNYYGDNFMNHPAAPDHGEIGNKAFVNSLVLIDDKGHIRGVSGAKMDTDIRNFFDMLKILKKEEFKANRDKEK